MFEMTGSVHYSKLQVMKVSSMRRFIAMFHDNMESIQDLIYLWQYVFFANWDS